MKDIELLPPEQPPIEKRRSQSWNLLPGAFTATLWVATLAKVLLRYQHAFAMWAIPGLTALAIVTWLALVPVLRVPEIPVRMFRVWALGNTAIGVVGCVAVLFAL